MSEPCASCGEERPIIARKLCTRCYQRIRKQRKLANFPSQGRDGRGEGVGIPTIDGLSYRQLDYWCREGYLRPEDCTGSGTWRKWPDEEIRVAQVMARLAAVGIPPAVGVKVAREGGDLGGGVSVVLAEIGTGDE